jgi:hypothetical protein
MALNLAARRQALRLTPVPPHERFGFLEPLAAKLDELRQKTRLP